VSAVHAAVLIVHDRELAEEIVENAFFQAVQKIHQFDDRRPFGPWFLRSVVNAALQEMNRQKRIVSLEESSEREIGKVAEWLIDPSLCPEDLVENDALLETVWKALDQLPPNQRAVLVMRYLQDRSETEITDTFQRPLTTIKWWLYDARERLRRILGKDFLSVKNDQEVNHE
jgi:RNA polymerase sigma-70 factor (ECF subfamily)